MMQHDHVVARVFVLPAQTSQMLLSNAARDWLYSQGCSF